MEQSKHSQEILELGKQLAAEFARGDSLPLSAAWMSHFLSEQITAVEVEKDEDRKKKLQTQCCSIIMELWRKRSDFPGRTKPGSELGPAIEVLSGLKKEEPDLFPFRITGLHSNISGWGDFIKKAKENFDETFAITMCLVLAKDVLDREKRWLDHEDLLSEDEVVLIKQLDELVDELQNDYEVRFIFDDRRKEKSKGETAEKKKSEKSRLERALERLAELASEHIKNVENLKLFATNASKANIDEDEA